MDSNSFTVFKCDFCDYVTIDNWDDFSHCVCGDSNICQKCKIELAPKYGVSRPLEKCYCKFSWYSKNNFAIEAHDSEYWINWKTKVKNGDHSDCEEVFGGPDFLMCPLCDPQVLTDQKFEDWMLKRLNLTKDEAIKLATDELVQDKSESSRTKKRKVS